MAIRELKNSLRELKSLDPAARTDGTANGVGADTQEADSALAVIHAGVVSDGTHTPKLQESDDDSIYNDVAALDQEGTLVDLTTSSTQRAAYKGNKQFVRVVITTTGSSTGAVASAMIVLGHPHATPTQP